MAFALAGQDPALLEGLLEPMLRLEGPEQESTMGKVLGQGLLLPGVALVQSSALDDAETRRLRAETIGWIREVIRSQWLPLDLHRRLFAMRGAVNGEDAFVGAWKTADRVFQLSVTSERLHLVTRSPQRLSVASEKDLVRELVLLAVALLDLPPDTGTDGWRVRRFGGLVLLNREVTFPKRWPQTLLFLTDGSGVKLQVMKYRNRTSPPERESALYEPQPWFPH